MEDKLSITIELPASSWKIVTAMAQANQMTVEATIIALVDLVIRPLDR